MAEANLKSINLKRAHNINLLYGIYSKYNKEMKTRNLSKTILFPESLKLSFGN